MARILTRKHECVEETVWEAVSGLILSLCFGDALGQRNRLIRVGLLVAIYNDVRHHGQLARLNLEIAHGEAIPWVAFNESRFVRGCGL